MNRWLSVLLIVLGSVFMSVMFTYFPDWLVATIVATMCLVGILGVLLTALLTHKRYLIQMRSMRNPGPAFSEWSTIQRFRTLNQAVTAFKTHHEQYIIPGFVEYRVFDRESGATGATVDTSNAIPTVIVGWGWGHGKRSWILP